GARTTGPTVEFVEKRLYQERFRDFQRRRSGSSPSAEEAAINATRMGGRMSLRIIRGEDEDSTPPSVFSALASPRIYSALASGLRPSARTATPAARRQRLGSNGKGSFRLREAPDVFRHLRIVEQHARVVPRAAEMHRRGLRGNRVISL